MLVMRNFGYLGIHVSAAGLSTIFPSYVGLHQMPYIERHRQEELISERETS